MVLHYHILKKIRERNNKLSLLLVNSSVRKSSRQLIFYMVPHNHIWKKICEKIFERKSEKEYSKKIQEDLSENLLWGKIEKGIKAFIAFSEALDKMNPIIWFFMVPHNHIWMKIRERIFKRKSAKEYSRENPRKNLWAKIRENSLEKKSVKQFRKKIRKLLLRTKSTKER